MKAKVIFRWYDIWVGVFINTKKVPFTPGKPYRYTIIYIFPVPMLGLKIWFKTIKEDKL